MRSSPVAVAMPRRSLPFVPSAARAPGSGRARPPGRRGRAPRARGRRGRTRSPPPLRSAPTWRRSAGQDGKPCMRATTVARPRRGGRLAVAANAATAPGVPSLAPRPAGPRRGPRRSVACSSASVAPYCCSRSCARLDLVPGKTLMSRRFHAGGRSSSPTTRPARTAGRAQCGCRATPHRSALSPPGRANVSRRPPGPRNTEGVRMPACEKFCGRVGTMTGERTELGMAGRLSRDASRRRCVARYGNREIGTQADSSPSGAVVGCRSPAKISSPERSRKGSAGCNIAGATRT